MTPLEYDLCVCEFVITVNRGHTLKLHIQTEDNIANEDGPRFVDTCKRLQIAYSCKYIHRGMFFKKEKITCTGFGPRFSAEKSYTSCVSAILHTKCPTVAGSMSNTHVFVEQIKYHSPRLTQFMCVCECGNRNCIYFFTWLLRKQTA